MDLAAILTRYGLPPLWDRVPGFGTLVHIILEQQVSLASAKAAYDRLLAATDPLTPETFLRHSDAELLAIGFSRQKARYCRALAAAIMYPVIYLVLFGPLLDGAIKQAGAGVSAYNWFVPGLLIQVALFGTAFGGFGLTAELRYGVVERMRVTPMSRAAMLLGRSLRDVVILLFQALLMIVLAIPFGLHIDIVGVAVTMGLLALLGLVVAPLSYAAALILKSEDAFAPLVQSLVMPLLLLSGILLPMALAPEWLRFLSNLNPLTHATDAARALFNSDWGNPEIAIGVAITSILAVIAVWIAARTFSRANA